MTRDPVSAARSFLERHLADRTADTQRAFDAQLAGLLAVESMLSVVRSLAGEAGLHVLADLEAARRERVEAIGALLSSWHLAGGVVALTPPPISGESTRDRAGVEAAPPELDADTPPIVVAVDDRQPEPAPPVNDPLDLHEAVELLRASFSGGREPRSGLVDAATRAKADAAALRTVVEPLTLPLDGWAPGPSEWADELLALERFTEDIDTRWTVLPARYQQLLVAVVAALARHLQDLEPLPADARPSHRLDPLFSRLTAYSRDHQPGSVNGLARLHTPRGTTWLDDAHDVFEKLRAEVGLPSSHTEPSNAIRASGGDAASGSADTEIDAFLIEEGFSGEPDRILARQALAAAKLSNARKQRIAVSKLDRARKLFRKARLRVCADPDCARLRGSLYEQTGPSVSVELAEHCDICAGSDNRRALLALVRCLRDARISRFLVVGGGDDARAELKGALKEWNIEVREVNAASGSHDQKEADALMGWAEIGVLWGSTQLPHKVSNLFRDPPAGLRMVNPNARGITSLSDSVINAVCPRP